MTTEEKIQYIAEHNGLEKALDKLAEECAEYVAARIKHSIGEGNGEYMEELADVFITFEQIQNLLPQYEQRQVADEINRKLDRQIERIRKENEQRNLL